MQLSFPGHTVAWPGNEARVTCSTLDGFSAYKVVSVASADLVGCYATALFYSKHIVTRSNNREIM